MNTQTTTETQYPNMDKIQKLTNYSTGSHWPQMFPNTIWGHSGLQRMNSCVGFLMGMWVAGQKDQAEELANTLFRSFHFGMEDETTAIILSQPKHDRPHSRKMSVSDDGTFLGFSFCLYGLKEDQSDHGERDVLLNGCEFEDYSYGVKYRYVRIFNGGILFHGLQQVFAVNLGGGSGWSMHT